MAGLGLAIVQSDDDNTAFLQVGYTRTARTAPVFRAGSLNVIRGQIYTQCVDSPVIKGQAAGLVRIDDHALLLKNKKTIEYKNLYYTACIQWLKWLYFDILQLGM